MDAKLGKARRSVLWVSAVIAVAAAAALVVGLVGGAAASGDLAAKRATVRIKGFKYHPKPLKVRKGTKVVFVNKDHARHTATDKGHFNTGKLKHNERAAVRFKHKGKFHYICRIHPFMKGTIVVH